MKLNEHQTLLLKNLETLYFFFLFEDLKTESKIEF